MRAAVRRRCDVVVVGSGPAGLAAARELMERGREVEILDDALVAGGGASLALGWAVPDDLRTRVRTSTTAAGVYGDDLLVVGPAGAEVVEARALVLAPGAHDGVLAFEGNDIPGVMSARAAASFLARGVRVGERVVVAVAPGGGPYGDHLARALASSKDVQVTLVRGGPTRALGSSRLKQVTIRDAETKKLRTLKADALLVDAPRAPAYELCEQAGAPLDHRPAGFVPRVAAPATGRIRDGVWAIGEVVTAALDRDRLAAAARALAADVVERRALNRR
jgi:sarcosine oxidase subunit alpha